MKNVLILFFLLSSVFSWGQYIDPRLPETTPSKLVSRIGYNLSYNTKTLNPNYVGWKLTKSRLQNKYQRTDNFVSDPEFPKVVSGDYTGSGYDRGHMCPAADNEWNLTAMKECFYMTNMCPQNHILNRQWWEHTEEACRRWVRTRDIYVVCGPIYSSHSKYIGRVNHVIVPTGFFKVVLDLKNKRAIGFYYENTGKRQTMEDAARSIDDLEKLTGMDFFYELPDALENKIEGTYNLTIWE